MIIKIGDSETHVKGLNFILIKNVPDKKELDSRIDKLVHKRVRELESARKGILSSSKGGFLSYL